VRERLISVLVAAAVVVSACTSATSTATPSLGASIVSLSPTATPTPQTANVGGAGYTPAPALTKGGKVTLAEWAFPHTVNPYYAQDETDIEVSESMFDGLLSVTPDLRYVPDLALNIPTVENGGVLMVGNGMDVSWTLRPLMQWSDGKPINCDDIAATWQWVVNKDNTGLAGGTIGWQDVTGVDGGAGTNCVMHFGRVYEGYLSLVSPLLPAHYITTIPVKDAHTKLYPMASLATGVYSGPYIPGASDGHGLITLKPNPTWQTIGGHAPWLSSVAWRYYADSTSMINGFKTGDYDVGQNMTNMNVPSLTGVDPAQVVVHDSLTYELLAFNNAAFKTKFGGDASSIVQAIKLATDRRAITAGLLGGRVSVANNFVSPLSWYYKDISTSIGGDPTAADPNSASALLANAGWTKGPDGYLAKAGKILELNYCTTTVQYRLDMLQLMANQLKAIGIKVDINSRPQSDVFGTWSNTKPDTACNLGHGNFDVAEFAYVSPLDPLRGYRVYHSSQIPDNDPHDGGNISRISLPSLDADYDTIAATADLTKVRAAMLSVQDIYGSDSNTYELPLYFRKDVWLVNPKIHNFLANPSPSGAEWNMGDWWVG
jgi:peptide/nickel transport system substrate-binding protein